MCCCCCSVASVMSDSVRPHRWQPARLPHPWDSPDKNTGVGCHFLLQGWLYNGPQRYQVLPGKCYLQSVQLLKLLSRIWLFAAPGTAAHQAFLSIINSQSLLKLMSIELVMPTISSSIVPFSFCLQSFPASGSFQMSWFFWSIVASALVLPMNVQDWFPLGWTG